MALIDISNIDLDSDGDSRPLWTVVADGYKYVLFTNHKALVYKGDNEEPSYEVTPVGCSCPGDRYSSNLCKHRKALLYIGDGSAVPQEEDTSVSVKEFVELDYDSEDLFG